MAEYLVTGLKHGSGIIGNLDGAATIAAYSLVYVTAAGQWQLADADLAATMSVVALATDGLPGVGLKGKLLFQGLVNNNAWTWTPGGEVYASAVAGALTQTKPVGAGDIVQPIGVAVTATLLYFDPKMSGEFLSITDYEIVTGEIAEPTIPSKGNGHNVVVEYSDDAPNRMVLWKRGTGDTEWFGVELL